MFEVICEFFINLWLLIISKKALAIIMVILVILFLLSDYIRIHRHDWANERNTYNEMTQIKSDILAFKNKTGALPKDINQIIGSNPLKAGLAMDCWNNPYQYEMINSSKKDFFLKSKGKDLLNSEDDLIIIIYTEKTNNL